MPMECNVIRIRSGATLKTSRPAYFIPVRILGSNPRIEETEMALGTVTHITERVKIEVKDGSELDLLYLMEKESNAT
jgi:hypothetical protein